MKKEFLQPAIEINYFDEIVVLGDSQQGNEKGDINIHYDFLEWN